MITLHPPQRPSKTVLEIGFEGDNRGNVHVQFHDGNGNPTSRGYYADVPHALFNALERDRKPGSIINSDLKNRFEWVPLTAGEAAVIDPTLPDVVVIPAELSNDIESISTYIDLQRKPAVKEGLF